MNKLQECQGVSTFANAVALVERVARNLSGVETPEVENQNGETQMLIAAKLRARLSTKFQRG